MKKKLLKKIPLIGCNIITSVCLLINIIGEPDPFLIAAFSIMSISVVMMIVLSFVQFNKVQTIPSEDTTNIDEQHEEEILVIDCDVIQNSMYMNNFNIKEVQMSDKILKIGNSAFKWCSYLTKVTLSNNLEHIGLNAFSNCHNLEYIYIPKSVKYIGGWAFDKCSKLTIYCEVESQPDTWEKNWNSSNLNVIWGNKKPTHLE